MAVTTVTASCELREAASSPPLLWEVGNQMAMGLKLSAQTDVVTACFLRELVSCHKREGSGTSESLIHPVAKVHGM